MNAVTTQSYPSPAEVDAHIRKSLPATVDYSLNARIRYPKEGGIRIVGYDLEPLPMVADLERAKVVLSAAMEPAPRDLLLKALTELRLATRTTLTAAEDLKAQTKIYIMRLEEWPADVALWAVREWPSRSQWWPAWAEILPLLKERGDDRRMKLDAIEGGLRRSGSAAVTL